MKQRIIGLTGGIGTGKSTVSDYLNQVYQVPVLDADQYARDAVRQGSPILRLIQQRYGDEILQDGCLNRSRLGEIIFNNPSEKQWLEQQIHPYVRQRIETELSQLKAKIVLVVIPLLFEAKMTALVTEIWVVACSPQQQLRRVMQRDGLSEKEARSRIQSQMSLPEKMARADVVLDNETTVTHLQQQIDQKMRQSSIPDVADP
ncbi:dephospho-CoA kinase [Halothece sp. PCC 7418]|uniref:dephospho-CoA kinase n=1 Tax=Halothece sp. (strain PCC 7418) TaxID=65093 RepID=UPI0002A06235|nr:dephospho-CoA kinase [Halothece sp. PCC 7418]AFZ42560.1 dephospho-CoA kinase [Halothece sp. PCC 7418]